MADINEREFPLDSDAGLRREVKLQIEREKAETAFKESRARLAGKLPICAFVSFVTALIFWKLLVPRMGWTSFVLLTVFISFSSSLPHIVDILWTWKEMRRAERQLENWDAVIGDYKKAVNVEEPSSKSWEGPDFEKPR